MTSPDALLRLSQMHTMLSRINRAITRATSPDALYDDACRIAGESGMFLGAWIGLKGPPLRVMASWGEYPVLEALVGGGGPLAQEALASGRPSIRNDYGAVPAALRGHAPASGIGAAAAFPFRQAEHTIGVLALYAAEAQFFDTSVCGLLAEVTEDISFSLDHMLNAQKCMAAEAKAHYLAFYSPQTGLPNRANLEARLGRLAAMPRHGDGQLTLVDIKLQRLDQITLALGHARLDDILRDLALRLDAYQGANGMAAQLAPDEFALLIPDLPDGEAVTAYGQRLHDTLSQAVTADGSEVFLSVGIGIAVCLEQEAEIQQLLPRARAAADAALDQGRVQIYTAGMDRGSSQRLELEAALHRALERGEFELHYQPQLNMKSGTMVGVEALLRWRHPTLGLMAPAHFIPLLEDCGLMVPVGEWVLRTACAQNKAWQDQGMEPLRVAVNVSALQLRLPDFARLVAEVLRESGLDAAWLELELTESLILGDVEAAIHTLHALKRLGLSLSLDDFGTGYSSLSYLRRLPIDRIKIDQSFVQDIGRDSDSAALVRTMLAMAHNLGLSAVAEGVENDIQLGYLRRQTCQELQGFLFSRALPPDELRQLRCDDGKLAPAGDQTAANYTLLAVDDEPHILTAMKRLFIPEGLTVLTAGNAADALAILATHPVGVIISDHRMPGMSGTEFLHQVKGLYPPIIRILLTGYADFQALVDAVNRGDLFKILIKPIDSLLLRDCIRDAFGHFHIVTENLRLTQELEALRHDKPG